MKTLQLYRKVLVACGEEPSGLHALKEIIKYVKNNSRRLIALSVVPFHDGDLHLWVFKDIEKEFKKPFEAVLHKVREISEKEEIIVKTILDEGEPFSLIIDTALTHNCDLIVLGRRKNLELMRKILGANVTRVIGYSPVDVLVIPDGSSLSFKKILVPLDGSVYSEAAFKKACKIAKALSSTLYLLSIIDLPVEISVQHTNLTESFYNNAKNILDRAKNIAKNLGIEAKVYIKEGDSGEKILSFIKEKNIEIIIMGSHGKTGLKRLLMGSVAEKVLTFTPVPVLVSKDLELL